MTSRCILIRMTGLLICILRVHADDFVWKSVPVGGGGYVTGLIVHPKDENLIYARTDVGGAYRWDKNTHAWKPLTEWISFQNSNLYGIESIAVDPSDENIVYAACGKNLSGSPKGILKSTNRGETWNGPYLSNVSMAGNDVLPTGPAAPQSRDGGERLAVDPHAGSVLYFGSRDDGLWKSEDSGLNWRKLAIPSEGTKGYGIAFVALDSTSGDEAFPCKRIYIGVIDSSENGGVYRSDDAGESWSRLSDPTGIPVRFPKRGQCSPLDGTLWVTHRGGVAMATSTSNGFADITPSRVAGTAYTALALDPADASSAVVIEGNLRANNAIFRTSDRGLSWSVVANSHRSLVPWWYEKMWAAAPSAALIRSSGKELWFSDWYGIWKTEDYRTTPEWTNVEDGHEELHVFSLLSMPDASPAELFTACVDVEGFRHDQGTDQYPSYSFGVSPGNGPNTDFQSTFGLDYCGKNPNFLLRASASASPAAGGVCKSYDNGRSWQPCPGWDIGDTPRNVAVASADPDIFVATVAGGIPLLTKDGGETFEPCSGIEDPTSSDFWSVAQPLAADRVEDAKFYYYGSGKFYATTGEGLQFAMRFNGLPASAQSTVRAMPAIANEVWLGLDNGGLWRTTDGGAGFHEIKSPTGKRISVTSFCFGKPGSGDAPWLYVLGSIDAQHGVFLSKDLGQTWECINPVVGCSPSSIQASWRQVGRVYVATRGRGVFQGKGQPPSPPTELHGRTETGAVTLSWNPSEGAIYYLVKRATTEGGPYSNLASVTSTTFTDSQPLPGANYYTVSAVGDYGEGPGSTPKAEVNPPTVPSNLRSAAGNRRIDLTWTPSTGADSYIIKRKTAPEGPFILHASVSDTKYTDLSVANGMIYFYVVSAENLGGESDDTESVSAIPLISYSDFQKEYFGDLQDTAIVSPDADPNGDGVRNLLAYAFNASPLASAVDSLPTWRETDGFMTLTFLRRRTADLTYTVMKSVNLVDWNACDDPNDYSMESIAPDLEKVTFRTRLDEPKGFLRVMISR